MIKKNSSKSRKQVIKFRQSLFWDVDPKTIDPKKHARYIIERILDLGYDSEVRWIWHFYSPRLIGNVVEKSRALHNATRSLWTLLLNKRRNGMSNFCQEQRKKL